jgi:hypothetical protein
MDIHLSFVKERTPAGIEQCRWKWSISVCGQVRIQVSSEPGIDPEQMWMPGKHPITFKARSLLCYWAVRKLGFSATELSSARPLIC